MSDFIVIHVNAAGHSFATRASGESEEAAANTVVAHHTDNRFIHVYPDEGQTAITHDGATLEVQNLPDEP